jgi:hypothetical protein
MLQRDYSFFDDQCGDTPHISATALAELTVVLKLQPAEVK